MLRHTSLLSGLLLLGSGTLAAPEDRDAKVLRDRSEVEATGLWIYGDLEAGIEKAKKSGRPLLVVFR
ncbi:MAG: hypothetical protein O7J95_17835 [Planctomycetota bacterium]|nr:hypothetical protein [Planctomycetota bacterium]